MAIAANHDISTVKMTPPPSSTTNLISSPKATTPSSTSPTRQTLDGDRRIVTPDSVPSAASAAIEGVSTSSGPSSEPAVRSP